MTILHDEDCARTADDRKVAEKDGIVHDAVSSFLEQFPQDHPIHSGDALTRIVDDACTKMADAVLNRMASNMVASLADLRQGTHSSVGSYRSTLGAS